MILGEVRFFGGGVVLKVWEQLATNPWQVAKWEKKQADFRAKLTFHKKNSHQCFVPVNCKKKNISYLDLALNLLRKQDKHHEVTELMGLNT